MIFWNKEKKKKKTTKKCSFWREIATLDFERLRDSLLRIPVPNDLKVRDSATGIKQDCKPTLKIIQKCARYAEVLLKVLSIRDEDTETDSTDKVFTCAVAQINFLQAEFANLVVKSSFDENTSRLFRQFENNSSVFNEQSLNSIRVAAELSSFHRSQTGPRTRARGRGQYDNYRSQFTRGHGNRGGYHQNSRPPLRREFRDEQEENPGA